MHKDTRSTKQRVLDLIANFTAAPITEKSTLDGHLSMTLADVRELCTEIEAEFHIMFDEDNEDPIGLESDAWVTVSDVINAVYRMTK